MRSSATAARRACRRPARDRRASPGRSLRASCSTPRAALHRSGQTRLRRDDDHEEDRRRRDRGRPPEGRPSTRKLTGAALDTAYRWNYGWIGRRSPRPYSFCRDLLPHRSRRGLGKTVRLGPRDRRGRDRCAPNPRAPSQGPLWAATLGTTSFSVAFDRAEDAAEPLRPGAPLDGLRLRPSGRAGALPVDGAAEGGWWRCASSSRRSRPESDRRVAARAGAALGR